MLAEFRSSSFQENPRGVSKRDGGQQVGPDWDGFGGTSLKEIQQKTEKKATLEHVFDNSVSNFALNHGSLRLEEYLCRHTSTVSSIWTIRFYNKIQTTINKLTPITRTTWTTEQTINYHCFETTFWPCRNGLEQSCQQGLAGKSLISPNRIPLIPRAINSFKISPNTILYNSDPRAPFFVSKKVFIYASKTNQNYLLRVVGALQQNSHI